MMRKHAIPFLAVDENIATVREARRKGAQVVWGSAARLDFLDRCGLETCRALIVTLDRSDVTEEIVRLVRGRRPDLTIVARARDAATAAELYKLGVTDAVPETIEASLQLSEAVLVDMGVPMGLVIASIHEKRDAFRKILQPVTARAKEKRALRLSLRIKHLQKRAETERR
jgi:CPA2 family monovalent cation:H+ antiporter-2